MKKKWIVFTITLLLAAGFIFTGCPTDSADKPDPDPNPGGGGADYSITASNGVSHKANTTIIQFNFGDYSVPRNGLLIDDITITGGTGSFDMVTLTNSPGPTRMLNISVKAEGDVNLKITKEGISNAVKTVTVFKKLGFQEDNSVVIGDIVKIGGTPVKGVNVTFGSYDGDPVAVLPPVTYEPVTAVNLTNFALEQVLATFDPPLDLVTDVSIGKEFRWFDMVWEGFGDKWIFENESTSGTITSKEWHLHNVQFYLDLKNTAGDRIRFQKTSETNTSTGEKNPVSFLKSNVISGTGNTPWGEGHLITEIKLSILSVQLRDPSNKSWPTLSVDRNCNFDDTWVSSLTAVTILPPPSKVLYTAADGWNEIIKNPKYGYDDTVNNNATGGIVFSNPQDGVQNSVRWDPIDISVTGTGPYTSIIVDTTPASFPWYGFGSVSMDEAGEIYKNMNWAGSGSIQIPLSSVASYGSSNFFNEKEFVGFFVQGNEGMTSLTITGITIE